MEQAEQVCGRGGVEGTAGSGGDRMWRVGSLVVPAAGRKTYSDDEELFGFDSRGGGEPDFAGGVGMGVMVCGGSAVFEDDEEAGLPTQIRPAASPARRKVSVGGQYNNLPTLPARRALLSGEGQFVDNTASVGAATTLIGSNFGVHFGGDKAKSSPFRPAHTATVEADILSNHKALECSMPAHLAVLNKIAGLTVDSAVDKEEDARGKNTWSSSYRLPKAPGSSDRAVLAPASLKASPHKCAAGSVLATPGGKTAQDNTADDGDDSRPTSESFCSSSGSDSEDGSGHESDAAGVFGASHRRPSAGGDEQGPGGTDRKHFCLGIRWFIRNNKLVVGSFSGWSVADKMGVKHGDILRAVDGVEVLNMVADIDGNHPAKPLLRGVYGSKCALHLMRVDVSQVRDMLKRPGAQAGKEKLILNDIHVQIPRLIAADI